MKFALYLIFRGAYIRGGLKFGRKFVLVIRGGLYSEGLIFWGLIFKILRYYLNSFKFIISNCLEPGVDPFSMKQT